MTSPTNTVTPSTDPQTSPTHTATSRADTVGRQAQAVVMLLLGGAVLRICLSGTYLRYVKSGLRPLLLLAGALLVVAAVMTLWYEYRPAGRRSRSHDDYAGNNHSGDHGHAAEDEHGHHREPRVGWLLLLPALGLLLLNPSALGSSAADQAGSVLAAANAPSDYAALPPGDPAQLGLLDYASRAVFDQGKTLTGRTVELTGFLTPGPTGQPVLARMMLNCCAADARPIKVGLAGDIPDGVPPDTWVTVVGAYVPTTAQDPMNDAVIPFLEVSSWRPITAPDEPYEIVQPVQ